MPKKKKVSAKTSPASKVIETVQESTPKMVTRGPSNLLTLLLIVVSFFAGYLFFKVKSLEQQAKQPTQAQQQNAGAEHLSVVNLKKYAKDLGLDTNKFNTCLDKDAKKDLVAAETKEGGTVGVQGTPGFLINGKLLGGAFPFEYFKEIIDKELNGTGSNSCTGYSEDLKKYCDEEGKNAFNPVPKNVEIGNSPVTGNANAKVTVIEYSDFECPFCIRAYPTVKQIMQAYPNDVKLSYKHFPLSNIHPKAQKAAEAAACAQEQGKFWEYHDKLFDSAPK
jgi:protein-disulfide isomerase